MERTKIGLALSGGGIRAAIFHLGVMAYLARAGLFGKIAGISSVSGASLCIGAIFAANNNRWPTAAEFTNEILPRVRLLILKENIQRAAIIRLPFHPKMWRKRVNLIAKMLEKKWGINGNLQDLPSFPFWEINCTTFETGSRFRFRRDYMGDQRIGYVQNPTLPVSHMIAASAAFPVLIGPYVLETEGLCFGKVKRKPAPLRHCGIAQESHACLDILDKYTLWDGGVYDNLGLDALHKIGTGLDDEINFLIVSNAGASVGEKSRGRPSQNLRRLLDISSAQIEMLRTRDFFSSVVKKGKGLYIKIGKNPENNLARNYPTTLNSPSAKDFDEIFQNGYQSMECAIGG